MGRRIFIRLVLAVLITGSCTTAAVAQIFNPGVSYYVGQYPHSVAIAYVDSDDHLDLVIANYASHNIVVMPGVGDGTFQPRLIHPLANNGPASLAVTDFNGDGYLDLAVALFDDDIVSVLLGNGDGTFQAAVDYAVGVYPVSIIIDRLDQDNIDDLAVANQDSDTVSILLGNGDGTFQAPVEYPAGDFPWSVASADLDGDGDTDLAVALANDGSVSILMGEGDGSFQAPVLHGAGVEPHSVAIGDLNGDLVPDLAVANSQSDDVSVLLGIGDGGFLPGQEFYAGDAPYSVTIRDLNLDGCPDLAVALFSYRELAILPANGDGTFQQPDIYEVGHNPSSMAVGDLDENGDPDLAVTNMYSGTVTVLIHNSDPPMLVTGPGPGPQNAPIVRVYLSGQDEIPEYEFPAYGSPNYGVNVTCGDPDADWVDEILTGAGPGDIYGPHVRGFEMDGSPVPGLSFLAYGTNKFGVNVAAGDLENTGRDLIVTGAGPGAVFGPHVRGWRYDRETGVTPHPDISYFAYGAPKWGVNVACGDITGSGYEAIITGAGPGAIYGPHVRGWYVAGGTTYPIDSVNFLAYGTNKYGVKVSTGDVDGDGIDELITGAGPGAVFGPHVRAWNVEGGSAAIVPGIDFFAWQTPPLTYGVNVWSGTDLDEDGRDELVVGRGPAPDAESELKVFSYDGSAIHLEFSLIAHPGLTHGATVAAGRF